MAARPKSLNFFGRPVFFRRFKISTAKCWNWVWSQREQVEIASARARFFRFEPRQLEQGPMLNLSPPVLASMLWQLGILVSNGLDQVSF
ncbi:MAG: hypothetical protein CMJ62_03880 [Planctomycetaceae bacterium]|nr:hypothetical protein [Planctomycetaceae bacterium]